MKKIYHLLFLSILFTLSCKKDNPRSSVVASLSLVNVVVDGSAVRLGNDATYISNNDTWPLIIREDNSGVYVWPVDDSLHPYYTNAKFEIEDRAVYSLYIGGTTTKVEGILVKETLPYYTDSVCGIRFVNLSPDSNDFNITLSSSPTENEVSNLTYKQITEFKTYPSKSTNDTYTFDIRNASDNTLLFSYTIDTPRFANVTLVIQGLVNGSPSIGITRVSNDRF